MGEENRLNLAIGETIGTFAIVFFGCGGLMIAERFPGTIPPGTIPIVFGLIVAAMIYALGHISGAHFNPAVTFAFALVGKFPWARVPLYAMSQVFGAFLALWFLAHSLPPGQSYGATVPAIPLPQALIWEILQTFFLMWVVMGTATDARNETPLAGIAIGSMVAIDAFIGGPITGASLNPARSLAPAYFQGTMDVYWIYFVGPIVGASLAAAAYDWLKGELKFEALLTLFSVSQK